MTIELPVAVEDDLRELAVKQGRRPEALVEEAIRTYVEASAIGDLDPEDVAETQVALIGELRGLSAWNDDSA